MIGFFASSQLPTHKLHVSRPMSLEEATMALLSMAGSPPGPGWPAGRIKGKEDRPEGLDDGARRGRKRQRRAGPQFTEELGSAGDHSPSYTPSAAGGSEAMSSSDSGASSATSSGAGQQGTLLGSSYAGFMMSVT